MTWSVKRLTTFIGGGVNHRLVLLFPPISGRVHPELMSDEGAKSIHRMNQ